MKFIITENKLENVVQKIIDKGISEIRKQLSNVNTVDEIPDWISFDSFDHIDNIESIKVSRIVDSEKIKIYVDVYINSMNYFETTEILYDIKHYIQNTFGIDCFIIENQVINNSKLDEW